MLAFGVLIGLDGSPVSPEAAARLRQALAATPGRASSFKAASVAAVHVTHEVPLDYDRDVPHETARGAVVMGALRLDDRDRLCRELRPEAWRSLVGASDASLAALAYERWGDRVAEHLTGDFAFCVWNAMTRQLICVRDHHGNRSLYWGRDGERFVVSTELAAVRSQAARAGPLREDAIASFLRVGWVQDPTATVWRDVYRLPRATTMIVTAGESPRVRTHWEFPTPAPLRYTDEADYAAHFSEVLGAALRDRLRAKSAVVFLSGGMDSTTLAATAQGAAQDVTLFAQTSGYPSLAPSDDDRLAPIVARRLGLAHDVLSFGDRPALYWLDDQAPYPAQPLDSPDFADWRVSSRAAASRSPIAISGEDGDALLHPSTLLAQLRSEPFGDVIGAWWRFWRGTGRRPWAGVEWRLRLRRAMGRGPRDPTPWLRESARKLAGAPPPSVSHSERPRTVKLLSSGLWEMLYEEHSPSVTGADLLVTFPFVDPRVIAFIFAIPPVPWLQNKQIMRVAMRDRLPAEVLARPKTALEGYIEARVAQWRAGGGTAVRLSERVARWVDREHVEDVYRRGHPYAVLDAWRVLQLDRWLAREGQGHA